MSTSTNIFQTSKYKCCWDFIHVQTGAQIIVALVLFYCGISLFDLIFYEKISGSFFYKEISVILLAVQYLLIFCQALFFGTVLLGIRRSDSEWFTMSLISTAILGIFCGIGSILYLIAANSKSSLGRLARYILEAFFVEVTDDVLVAGIVFNAAKMVIALFFFDILYRCSKYIDEKSRQERKAHARPVVVQWSFPQV